MKLLVALLIALQITAFAATALAQSAELFEQKSKLEKLITEKMKTTIATSLDRSAYDVSVTVTLAETSNKAPKNNDKEPTAEEGSQKMEDLQLGLLNADELIRNYQKEIKDLKLAKESAVKPHKDTVYEVKQIHVTVGLQEDLGETYVKEFQSWLESKVKGEFGKSGKASVNKIKLRPPVADKKVKTLLDYAKDFQFAISTLLAILGLMTAVVLFKMLRSRDLVEDKKMQLQLARAGKNGLEEGGERDAGSNKKSDVAMFADIKNMKDLMSKMVMLLSKSDLDLNKIVQTWLESGGDGLQKTACIFDSLLSQNGPYKNDDDNIELLRSVIVPDAYKKAVAETLLTMKDTPNDTKIRYLESAYWDLLSFQTIGDEFIKRPFNYINAVDPKDIKDVLLSQPSQVRSIALLSLPQDLKMRVVSELDPEAKRELINESMETPDIGKKELDLISESLKAPMLQKGKKEEKVSSIELLPSLLETLTVVEEITFLADLKKNKPEQTLTLRSTWPTLAFIEDWKEESVKKLISFCTTDELEALIKTLPESQEVILPLASNRVREIILDSLRISADLNVDENEKHLKAAKEKLLAAIKRNELKLQSMYKNAVQENTANLYAA